MQHTLWLEIFGYYVLEMVRNREQDREIIIGCENKKAIFLMFATALASEKGINIFSNF